jgi:hypothetical protein
MYSWLRTQAMDVLEPPGILNWEELQPNLLSKFSNN